MLAYNIIMFRSRQFGGFKECMGRNLIVEIWASQLYGVLISVLNLDCVEH